MKIKRIFKFHPTSSIWDYVALQTITRLSLPIQNKQSIWRLQLYIDDQSDMAYEITYVMKRGGGWRGEGVRIRKEIQDIYHGFIFNSSFHCLMTSYLGSTNQEQLQTRQPYTTVTVSST